MNLAQIRYFLTLAETLNFTDAARLCGVAQPTLTRAIQKLEHELGGTLVYRDGKDTRLTSLGSDVREEFAAIVGAEDRIRASVNSRISGRRERLNLGIAHSVAPAPISRFITHALGEMPMLEILLHPIDGKMGSGLLLAGTLDGVFLADKPADNTKLSVIELFSERLMLACASSHRLAKFDMVPPEEIGVESYLDRLGCDFRSQAIDYFMNAELVMRPRLQSEREDWMQQAVADGAGICLLPEFSAIVPGLALRPVSGLNLERQVSFVSVSGSGNAPALRHLRMMVGSHRWPHSAGASKQ